MMTSSIYVLTNRRPLITVSIRRCNELGAPVRPKGIHVNWYSPISGPGQNAVFSLSFAYTGSCLPCFLAPHLAGVVGKNPFSFLFFKLPIVKGIIECLQTFSTYTAAIHALDLLFYFRAILFRNATRGGTLTGEPVVGI